MTNKLPAARALEARLTSAFEKLTRNMTGPAGASPLELVDQASDEIARQVVPAGRGRYTFPFNSVTIVFAVQTPEAQARLDAICAGPPSVHERVLRRLASAGCDQAEVEVQVSFASEPDPAWARPEFHIALARLDRAARPSSDPAPSLRIELVVTHGTADRGAYSFTTLPIAIGRGTEVRDHRQHLVRLNHVAFVEGGDDVTQSVSRRHARIEIDQPTGRPRVIDDNSAQGTSVIRNGRGIAVPRGSRGLGLQSGDEIVLGQARLKIEVRRSA